MIITTTPLHWRMKTVHLANMPREQGDEDGCPSWRLLACSLYDINAPL